MSVCNNHKPNGVLGEIRGKDTWEKSMKRRGNKGKAKLPRKGK